MWRHLLSSVTEMGHSQLLASGGILDILLNVGVLAKVGMGNLLVEGACLSFILG